MNKRETTIPDDFIDWIATLLIRAHEAGLTEEEWSTLTPAQLYDRLNQHKNISIPQRKSA